MNNLQATLISIILLLSAFKGFANDAVTFYDCNVEYQFNRILDNDIERHQVVLSLKLNQRRSIQQKQIDFVKNISNSNILITLHNRNMLTQNAFELKLKPGERYPEKGLLLVNVILEDLTCDVYD